MCHPMVHRQAYYRYIFIVVILATCLEVPRFFEFKLIELDENTMYYDTTTLNENPYYVQFNSYWNELLTTGIAPLIALCYMNMRIFIKIKVNTKGHNFLQISHLKTHLKIPLFTW